LRRHRFREEIHRSLRGIVPGQPRARPNPGGRADIDDYARLLLAHQRYDRMREQEDRFDVDRHEAIEFSLLHLEHGPPHVAHAGVVDENVDSPKRVDGRLDAGLYVRALGDVAAHGDRLVADRSCGLPRRLGIDVDDRNTRAFACERLGDAFAEARCRAGDERNLVVETHAGPPLSLCCFLRAPRSSRRKRGPIFQDRWLWIPAYAGTTQSDQLIDQSGLTPEARAQPKPSSVLARGRYSQPTHLR